MMMVYGSSSSSNSGDHQDNCYVDCLPPGYRFCPMDPELLFYLNKKVHRQPLPPNNIIQLNLYAHHPQQLAERYRAQGGRDDNEWFFFTQRERRYSKGHRPNRAIEGGHGHWKATGTEREIIDVNGKIIGYKRSLVFYQGLTHVDGIKTNWLMHEFRLPPPPTSTPNNRFDDYVLCRVYKKSGRGSSSGDRCRGAKRLRSDESAVATFTNEEAVASNSTSSKIPKLHDHSPNEADASHHDLQLITVTNDHTLQNHQHRNINNNNIVETTAPRIPSESHDHVAPRQPPEPAEAADHVFLHNHNNHQMMMQHSTDFAYPNHTPGEVSSSTSTNDIDSAIFDYISFGDGDGDGDGSGFCSAIGLSPSYMRGGGCERSPNYYSNNIHHHHHHHPIAMPSMPSSVGEDLWVNTNDTFVFNPSYLQ